MANLLITDNPNSYEKWETNKVEISGVFFKMIVRSNSLTDGEIASINESFIQQRLLCGDKILEDIKSISERIPDFTNYYSGKTSHQNVGITQLLLRPLIEKKWFILTLVELLRKAGKLSESVDLQLSEDYALLSDYTFKDLQVALNLYPNLKRKRSNQSQSLKNLVYSVLGFKRLFKSFKTNNKPAIVFLIQTAEHHHELLNGVYQLVVNDDHLQPIVVSYPLDIGDPVMFKKHIPEGMPLMAIQEFRGVPKMKINRNVFSFLHLVDLPFSSVEANYAMMDNMVKHLRPSVCVTVGYQDTGRYLSDVCRLHNIPTVSIDYSFITDDYTFEKHICYDYKCVISEVQKAVWQNRNDPTKEHLVTGYLKYDSFKATFDKECFFRKYELDEKRPTIFFASSHGYDPLGKRQLIIDLAEFCTINQWNLIIKTHPLENDGIAKAIIKHENQVALSHDEVTAMECVYVSDVVVSQGSSIVLDALFYLKPFVTLSQSDELVITDFMPIANESFVFKALEMNELESKLTNILNERDNLQSSMRKVRDHYLFKTDGLASLRVFDLIKKLALNER